MLSVSLGAEDAGFTATLTSAASAVAGFAGRINSSLGGFREVRSDIGGMTGALQRAQSAATPVAAALHTVEAAVRGLGAVSRTVGAAMLLFPRAFSGLPAALTKTIAGVSMAGSAMDAFRGKVGLVGAAMIYAQARALGLQKHWSALAAAVAFGTSQMSKAWNSVSAGPRQMFSSMSAGSLGLQRSMSGLIGQIAAFAGAAGVGALAGLGLKKSISGAADSEDLRTTFRVLLGDAKRTGEAMKEATDFADLTPFDPVPVQEGYKTLLAYGFALKDIKGLMTDAGDLASVMKVNLGDVTKVFGRLQSGDFGEAFERLRDFGISRQDLEGKGLEFDKGGSFQGSADQAMTAVRAIIQEKFGGTMDAVSQTWNGKWSTLMGYVDAIFREFGTPLIGALKPLLDEGIEFAKQATVMAKSLGTQIASSLQLGTAAVKNGRLGDLLGLSLQIGFAKAINYLAGGLKTAIELLGEQWKIIFSADGLTAIFAALSAFGSKLAQILLTAFQTPLAYMQAAFEAAAAKFIATVTGKSGLTDKEKELLEHDKKQMSSTMDAQKLLGKDDPNYESRRKYMQGLAAEIRRLETKQANSGEIDIGARAEEIKNAGGVSILGRNAADFGAQAEESKTLATDLLEKPLSDFSKTLQEKLKNFIPADIMNSEGAQKALADLVAGIKSEIPNVQEVDGKPRVISPSSSDDGLSKDAIKALPVSSLGKIGGGNYSNAATTLQREANALLKQVVKNTADAVKLYYSNTGSAPVQAPAFQ